MPLQLITAPTSEPITPTQFKLHARIDRDDEDSLISGYITAARKYAETFQRRQLQTATWKLYLDEFPAWELYIPIPPLQTVSSISYVDSAGVTQTLSASTYLVDAISEPGRITPAYGYIWPVARCQANAVTVQFVAGYGALPTTVPQTTRNGIHMLAAHWYENRELVAIGTIVSPIPMTVEALLSCERWGGYP